MYYDKYVIKKEDVPESYYHHQEDIALERGLGHIKITESQKQELQQEVIENQKRSLDVWLDYFLSEDAKVYPFWAKYWAFQGMLKLGTYDKKEGTFQRYYEELSNVKDMIIKYLFYIATGLLGLFIVIILIKIINPVAEQTNNVSTYTEKA